MSVTEPSKPTEEPIARRISGRLGERPREEPPRGTPIALRSVQHSIVSRGRFEPSWSKRIVMAKWVLTGEAAMGIGGNRIPIRPGHVAIYLPSMAHQFWAVEEQNEMCWFTVDGPLAEQFMLDLDLRAGVFPCRPIANEKLDEMINSLNDHTIQGRRFSSLLVIQTLYELANSIRTPEIPSEVRRAQYLIQQEYADPALSTESLAAKLFYHRGSLSRLFHKHTGVTIIDYITQVRLQAAKGMLQYTGEKISTVARKCGFRETTYFCRWLRKHTNMSPSELRGATQ